MDRREAICRTIGAGLAVLFPFGSPLLAAPDHVPPFLETWVLRDGAMVLVRMFDLHAGDIFCLRNPATAQILNGWYYKAEGEPYLCANGSWGIYAVTHEKFVET